MTTRQYILFAIPSLIWGSTWYAIKFQLGTVDPLLSVAYRFLAAGILLILFCLATGRKMKFSLHEHLMMLLLGLCLFGINYWFVYEAETILTSGVVAVIFSLIIFFNIFFNAVLLKGKVKPDVILAAVLGVGGTALLFKNELKTIQNSSSDWIVFLLCLGGLTFASLGNIISAYKQKKNVPVLQANAYGMLYGGLAMFTVVLITGKPLNFETSLNYSVSLLYLTIFGSIVAFSTYLKLLGEIGPDRSIYVTLITPAIALLISTFFEGYRWDVFAVLGILLLFSGNILALRFKTKKTVS
ncbi:EamA family transporter [Draconibacterium sp. IB214405]|uniref:DMT family transporter n=1 Tax=Draconibacterium sp. IB214405 TaxID=3097352 RepID=UPI002A147AAE|nr:EamA family transporter [Draconibacterium sp. IB214405]MDX8340181.1 EamA family transporter [Draconibacterium sp. IB214405]